MFQGLKDPALKAAEFSSQSPCLLCADSFSPKPFFVYFRYLYIALKLSGPHSGLSKQFTKELKQFNTKVKYSTKKKLKKSSNSNEKPFRNYIQKRPIKKTGAYTHDKKLSVEGPDGPSREVGVSQRQEDTEKKAAQTFNGGAAVQSRARASPDYLRSQADSCSPKSFHL